MKFYTWCNAENEKLTRLVECASSHGISIESIGGGRDMHEGGRFNGKNLWLYEKVCELDENEIVVCTDAFDVIYLTNADEIKQKFLKMNAPIVYSAEFYCCHQSQEVESVSRELGREYHFKYLNAGAMIGYAKNIKEMFEVIFEYDYNSLDPRMTCDQGFIGKYFIENPGKIKLDYDCQIFWTDFDFMYFDNHKRLRKRIKSLMCDEARLRKVVKCGRMYNIITDSYPCIFHASSYGHKILPSLLTYMKEEN